MKTGRPLLVLIGIGAVAFMGAREQPELQTRRLSDRSLLIIGGRESNNVVALSTTRGIVVVDSGESPAMGRGIRALAQREFERSDFACLINTHEDWDHVQGNQVFSDVPIIGHVHNATALKERSRLVEAAKERSRNAPVRPPAREQAVRTPPGDLPPPPPVGTAPIDLAELTLTPPDLTFTDRMALHLGDMTVKLIYFGRAHSRSDILILVPEERMLCVGDLFYKKSLPVFAGRTSFDIDRWLEVMDEVLDPKYGVEIIIPGHGPLLDRAEFIARCTYVRTLVTGVSAAVREGLSLDEVQDRFALDKRFPELSEMDVKGSRGGSLHRGNVEAFWKHASGKRDLPPGRTV